MNWKAHPRRQKSYIKDSVEDAGWAKNTIFCANTERLIDGHGRLETAIEQGYKSIPVDVGWWTKEQGDILLASLDPSTQMATIDPNALQSLTLSNLKGLVSKNKKTQLAMMKDVNSFANSVLKGKKDHINIRQSKKSLRKLIGDSDTTQRDNRIKETDNEQLYDTTLREDLLFPSSGNDFGIPDLLPSKLYASTELPTSTFIRDGSPLLSSAYYCHNTRPFDSRTHLKPTGGILGFYCEDSRFEGLFERRSFWGERLVNEKWAGIVEPDYSTYWDWPFAKRLWSVYKSRWCARYWQQLGLHIIPCIRRTNDIKRDKWIYSSLPREVPVGAMQLRMGNKKNSADPNYWKGVGVVLKYMVKEKKMERIMFYGNPNLEKYITGFLPAKLDYVMVTPFIDARKKVMKT